MHETSFVAKKKKENSNMVTITVPQLFWWKDFGLFFFAEIKMSWKPKEERRNTKTWRIRIWSGAKIAKAHGWRCHVCKQALFVNKQNIVSKHGGRIKQERNIYRNIMKIENDDIETRGEGENSDIKMIFYKIDGQLRKGERKRRWVRTI